MSNPLEPDRLEDIFCIRMFFTSYLLSIWGVKEENLEKVFLILCEDLRQGKESKKFRQMTIHTLLANDFHQYKIAKLLNVSVRTVGRDVKEMADRFHTPRFWKRGILREGKLREKEEDIWKTLEKMIAPLLKENID